MDEAIKQIGERLKGLREVLNIPAEEVAELCEISLDHYLKIESGTGLLEEARAILEEYGVGGWAGFSGHDPNVLDGSSFRLEAVLADGTRIEAHGENKFPPNYRDVMGALDDLTAAAQKNALQQYTP